MVSWLHVVEAWKSKAVTLPPISIYEEKGSVDLFKLPVLSTTVEKPIVKPVVKPVVNRTEIKPEPPQNTVRFERSVMTIEKTETKESLIKPTKSYTKDPLSIGMNLRDPLYFMASDLVKRRMECEEAQRLETVMRSIYQAQGGRARGWTLSGLEAFLKPRGASGGNIHELMKAKSPFLWDQVLEEKNTSAFLDFICVAQRIRVAVWSDATKSVTVFPAADAPSEDVTPIPLFHVYSNGSVKSESVDSKTLPSTCASMGYAYLPPPSVMKSLAHLSLEELNTLAEKLDFHDLTGSKAQRVVLIAVWKLKQRLLA